MRRGLASRSIVPVVHSPGESNPAICTCHGRSPCGVTVEIQMVLNDLVRGIDVKIAILKSAPEDLSQFSQGIAAHTRSKIS